MEPQIEVNHNAVSKISKSWGRRAIVRSRVDRPDFCDFDADLPDFPSSLIPFFDHPLYVAAPEEKRREVTALAWIAYNERTVAIEDEVVNPSFLLIAGKAFPGAEGRHFQEAMRQGLVDEHYHTLMHLEAIKETEMRRGIAERPGFMRPVTCRRLEATRAGCSEGWERDLMALAFGVVSEVSVSAYLDLLAKNHQIQPANRRLVALHNRDEFGHGKLLAEVCKALYNHMSSRQREFFVGILPEALIAFVSHDYSVWETILDHVDIERSAEIIADVRHDTGSPALVRDYRGMHELAAELGVLERVDFDFSGTV
jgi:hypothetical protein